ncbi:MAG: hypothetical protein D6802_08915 [Ardenticatenia bacterium]|nr:MAG: hypothetical protein D6802_08915 [Ardenticatenia bacterium]
MCSVKFFRPISQGAKRRFHMPKRQQIHFWGISLALFMFTLLAFFAFVVYALPSPQRLPHATTEATKILGDDDFLVMLNPDGTLNLDKVSQASFQLNGWLMEILPDGTPRFIPPTAPEARSQAAQIGTDNDWSKMFDMWGVRKSSGTATVNAILVLSAQDRVFVGGDFDIAGSKSVNNIAMWNMATGKWSDVGGGLNGVVRDMTLGAAPDSAGSGTPTDGIYVVGDFTADGNGTKTLNRIAFWDLSAKTWKPVGNGVTSPGAEVHCVTVFHYITGTNSYPYVYIGGLFTEVSSTKTVNNVAVFNGDLQNWQKLLESGQTNDGVRILGSGSVPVRTCTNVADRGGNGGSVFFGGDFDTIGDGMSNDDYLAMWDVGGAWSALGGASGGPFNGPVYALRFISATINSTPYYRIYVGGNFTQPHPYFTYMNMLSDPSLWSWAGFSNGWAPNGPVYAISRENSSTIVKQMLIGGDFTQLTDGSQTRTAQRTAIFDIDTLDPNRGPIAADGPVNVIAQIDTSGEFIGGGFDVITDTSALPPFPKTFTPNKVGFYSRQTSRARFLPLGRGFDVAASSRVHAIYVDGSTVYVGGQFQKVGATTANNIAMWDTNDKAWNLLGGGLNGPVYALTKVGNILYAGGNFTQATQQNGTTVNTNYIAAWDTSANTWSPVDGGTNGTVYALATDGTTILYAGGDFTQVKMSAPINAGHVAQFDISSGAWVNDNTFNAGVGTGASETIRALAFDGVIGRLYIGGQFGTVGGSTTAFNVAYWDGSAWNALIDTSSPPGQPGVSGGGDIVYALAVAPDGSKVYVGGDFANAGNFTVNSLAYWDSAGSTWQPISGPSGGGAGVLTDTTNSRQRGIVRALRVSGSGEYLHVGGTFDGVAVDTTSSNDRTAYNIAIWNNNTNQWDTLGTTGAQPATTPNGVYAIGFGSEYIGGEFTTVGGTTKSISFARFDKIGPTAVTVERFEATPAPFKTFPSAILFGLLAMAGTLMGVRIITRRGSHHG